MDNSAVRFGGALFVRDGGSSLTVRNSMFGRNGAINGGVVVPHLYGTGAIVFSNCSFVRNSATNGGVYWGVHGFAMLDCLFLGNEAVVNGGVIFSTFQGNAINVIISGSSFDSNSAYEGGVFDFTGL